MSNLDNLRVLIVDDESFMRSTIRAVLRVIPAPDSFDSSAAIPESAGV